MSNSMGQLSALLYDVLLQGPPEALILGPRRRKLIRPMRGLILEIGAGTGISLRYYSAGTKVIATDVDGEALLRLRDKARSGAASAQAVQADAARLPFADATFDGLVCNLALCTIPEPRTALKEINRVLKPGAPAHFLEHVEGNKAWEVQVQKILAPAWARMAGGCRLGQNTERLIREEGLEVRRVERRGGIILPMKLIWAEKGA